MDISMDEEQSAAKSIRGQKQLPDRFTAKVLASYIVVLLFQLLLVFAIYLPAIRTGHADFRNMYSAGYMVRAGHGREIYDAGAQKMFQDELVSRESLPLPFIRPAYQALFYVPLSLLPFRQAYFVFLAFNLAVLLLCAWLLHPYMSNVGRLHFYLPSLLFLFFPITVALMQGQDSILLLALLTGALVCIQRNREYAAGALVALGLFKFQLVIPIFLLFLAWRRWRFSASFACTSVVLAGVSLWILGMAQSVRYFHLMIGVGTSLGFSAGSPLKLNLMANFHGALYTILKGSPSVLPLTAAASAATMIFVAWRRPQGVDALLFAIPASALVSYYMYPHDMSILILPIVVLLDRLIGVNQTKYRYRHIQIVATVLLLAAPTCLLIAINQFWIAALPLLAFTFIISWCQSTAAA